MWTRIYWYPAIELEFIFSVWLSLTALFILRLPLIFIVIDTYILFAGRSQTVFRLMNSGLSNFEWTIVICLCFDLWSRGWEVFLVLEWIDSEIIQLRWDWNYCKTYYHYKCSILSSWLVIWNLGDSHVSTRIDDCGTNSISNFPLLLFINYYHYYYSKIAKRKMRYLLLYSPLL